MATVPQPTPTRLAHDIAALYGRDDDTLLAWQRACAQAAETLRGAHDEERLRKALTLAQDGHVTLEDDGYATVDSHGKRYEVQADGACACPDAQHRGATCKHALAVQMHYLASASLRPGGDHRHAPTATPTPAADEPRRQGWKPTPKTSAGWDVHEAPASACFKFRVGSLELLYTLRGVDDAELLRRMAATLPMLQEVMEACEERAAQRVAERAAAQAAQAAQAQPAPASVPAALQALLQQAVQELQATREVVDRLGDQDQKAGLQTLEAEVRAAIRAKDPEAVRAKVDDLISLRVQAELNDPGFWVGWFRYLQEKPLTSYTDRVTAERLLRQGTEALNRNDLDGLKSVVRQLARLLSPEESAGLDPSLSGLI